MMSLDGRVVYTIFFSNAFHSNIRYSKYNVNEMNSSCRSTRAHNQEYSRHLKMSFKLHI